MNELFKFSVSFATEVERNRQSHECFKRGLRSTKDLKRANGHLSSPTNNARDLKSLLLSWKTLYPFSFKCLKSEAVMACVWLPPFLFFIFYFSVAVISSLFTFSGSFSSTLSTCCIFLLAPNFSARNTFFLLYSGFWNIFLTFLLLFCLQNQIVVC